MAATPDEVLIDVDAEDNASPTLRSVGMSFNVLGATVGLTAREFGIHNAAVDAAVGALREIGYVIRSVHAIQVIYAEVLALVNAEETENAAATTQTALTKWMEIAATEAETTANYGLAASFAAVNVAMGPIGWALLAAGVIGAGVVGYGLAGGFGGGAAAPAPAATAAPGLAPASLGTGVTTTINIANANLSTKRDVTETVSEMGTLWHEQLRRRRSF
jgi:hypothetical protein